MQTLIKKIDILGLYNNRNFSVVFKDNTLILVGENGSGKTTISRIIYAVLSCNWDLLNNYPFKKIVVYFGNDTIEISENVITDIYRIQDIDRMSYFVDRKVGERGHGAGIISTIFDLKNAQKKNINNFHRFYRLPYEYISEIINKDVVNTLYEITQKINNNFPAQILYLPTYRRIEEQLQNIFPEVDIETWEKKKGIINNEKVIELVEFGMNDVRKLVDDEIDMLRSSSQARQNKLTLGYLGEIVSKAYERSESYKKIRELKDEEIKEVLARIDSSILSEKRKHQLLGIINDFRATNKHSYPGQVKIICHYFMQLWEFNNEIKNAESNIRAFEQTANRYLVNNTIIYNSENYSCDVFNILNYSEEKMAKIKFQDLSSGEKQIVSLFSHLYLDKNEKVFVFIDEPELSLSVDWQKTFLPDIVKSPKFVGLLATTHSPFVFDNDLENSVHGINEFVTKG
jgi:predicted ATP-binding protein involved in virulence